MSENNYYLDNNYKGGEGLLTTFVVNNIILDISISLFLK